jgi:hypothetical protein
LSIILYVLIMTKIIAAQDELSRDGRLTALLIVLASDQKQLSRPHGSGSIVWPRLANPESR